MFSLSLKGFFTSTRTYIFGTATHFGGHQRFSTLGKFLVHYLIILASGRRTLHRSQAALKREYAELERQRILEDKFMRVTDLLSKNKRPRFESP